MNYGNALSLSSLRFLCLTGLLFCQLPAQAEDPLSINPANLTLQPPVINMFNGMPVQSGQADDVLNRKQPDEEFNPR